jgi:hypothetical protein
MKGEGFLMHTRIQGEPLSASTINRWITRSQQKIDLRLPIRRHRQARTRIIVGIVCVAVVVALTLHWLWKASYGL